jgi:hypothetical protein
MPISLEFAVTQHYRSAPVEIEVPMALRHGSQSVDPIAKVDTGAVSVALSTTESITGKTGVAVFEFSMSNMPPAMRGTSSNSQVDAANLFHFSVSKTAGLR